MLLSLSEMQEMIESSVLEFLANEYDFLKRPNSLKAANGIAPAIWASFAEMGWLGLPVPEELGGIGGRAIESGLVMRAFGRYLVVEPYVGSVLLGTRLLVETGRAEQIEAWLSDLIEGRRRLVLAHEEFGIADPWAARTTRATKTAEGYRLDGQKILVQGAPGADGLLVSAVVDQDGRAVTNLFLVSPETAGLSLRAYRSLDGSHAADLQLDGVQVSAEACLGDGSDVTAVLDRVLAEAIISRCWEASGAMQAALEQTATYTQNRVQFGQPISKFQVIQHRLAEMAVRCEEARAACELAALRVERDPASAKTLASMAKSTVGRAARFVAQEAVQLHGAMGVSEELAIPSYFRKLQVFMQQHGSTAWHGERYGALMLASDAWRESQTMPSVVNA